MRTRDRRIQMGAGPRTLRLGVALLVALGLGFPAEAGQPVDQVLVLAPPLARADSLWMAQAKGFFKEERLQVSVRWLSSGNEALRTFQGGQNGKAGFGDFVITNELLAVNVWQSTASSFHVIAALARDAEGYVAVARTDLKGPRDLAGKNVGTQMGSTSAWFLGEYLRAHGMSERDLALKNVSPDAVANWEPEKEDTAAFFVREPYGSRALAKHGNEIHRLTTAKGYMSGYLLIGTWGWYLREHPGVAERFLRALDKGRRYAEEHRAEVVQFAREMFTLEDPASLEADYETAERVVGLDQTTLQDFQKLARWMKDAGLATRVFDQDSFLNTGPLRTALPERLAPGLGR